MKHIVQRAIFAVTLLPASAMSSFLAGILRKSPWSPYRFECQLRRRFDVPRIKSSRYFGSKQGSGVEGSIFVTNDQNAAEIDERLVRESMKIIREQLQYSTYDVTLVLADDEYIRELNRDYRDIDSPTDILSFPFADSEEPGQLPEPDFDFPDFYCLGDMMISVPYVMRQIKNDRLFFSSQKGDVNIDGPYDSLSAQYADTRGVSGAMATEYNLERRIGLLLIHGMLHLTGYDHIEDNDYLVMVKREEEIIEKWRKHVTTLQSAGEIS